MPKNWKSTVAFILFVAMYIYSVITKADPAVVSVTGYIAMYSSLFMMFRSDFTSEMLSKLIDNFSIGNKK